MMSWKTPIFVAFGLSLAGAVTPAWAQSPEPVPAPNAEITLLKQFGWMMSQNIKELDLSDAEVAAFQEGLSQGLAGEQLVAESDLEGVNQQLQAYFRDRFMSRQNQANADFFTNLAKEDGVVKSDSGLHYKILNPGGEQRAALTDSVKVHYTGTLTDGTVFDSSRERGQPATFPVNRVVSGFSEGVRLVGPGGRVMLYIPSNLGYGDNGQGSIPPRSTLVFDVEVIEVIAAE